MSSLMCDSTVSTIRTIKIVGCNLFNYSKETNMKKLNKKGFTLAELLIVVAIIAVLVAISIPVFSSQLEKAREATDMANIRAAYAEAVTDLLEKDASSTFSKTVDLTSNTKDWRSADDAKIAGISAKILIGSDTEKKTSITVKVEEEKVYIGDTEVAK